MFFMIICVQLDGAAGVVGVGTELLSVSLAVLLTDQSVSAFIELFYSELGPSEAFWIWWIQTFFLYFVAHIVLPAFCLRCGRFFHILSHWICFVRSGMMEWSEFQGLSGQTYPGQPPVRWGGDWALIKIPF